MQAVTVPTRQHPHMDISQRFQTTIAMAVERDDRYGDAVPGMAMLAARELEPITVSDDEELPPVLLVPGGGVAIPPSPAQCPSNHVSEIAISSGDDEDAQALG